MKLTGYLPDRFLVPVVSLEDFTDGFHYQHLLSKLLSLDDAKENGGGAEVGQFWTPITPESGSILHADSQAIHSGNQRPDLLNQQKEVVRISGTWFKAE